MTRTSTVRADARGPYLRTGGHVFRPGAIRGWERSTRMDDGGLAAGDRVAARHRGGTPLARIVLPDGSITHWAEQDALATSGVPAPTDLSWRPDGRVDLDRADGPALPTPRTIAAVPGGDVPDALGGSGISAR